MKNIFIPVLMGLLLGQPTLVAADDLSKIFQAPPDAAKPSCFWWWFNSLVNKEGITHDLEEFKAKGMGGVMLVCSGNEYGVEPMPRGPVFLSPEWRELYKHALAEADRLGLEVGVNFCGGGWCMGGAWITPKFNARWFVQSKLTVSGPQAYSGKLPIPEPRDGYKPPHCGNVAHYMTWPKEKMDYRDSAVVAFREPDGDTAELGKERLKALDAKSNRQDADCFAAAASVMESVLVPWVALPSDTPIPPTEIVDLGSKMKPDGSLDWDVPAGRWTILRTGHVATGADVRCVLPELGYVLEVDWLNPAALDLHFKNLGDVLLGDAGPLKGKTLKYLHTDSFEDGYPNWTGALLKKFQEYRGYDPKPYLPVFAGKLVGSAEISDRFLHDYRKTVADCMADGSYGRLAELAGKQGLEIQGEAAGPSWSATMCMDGLKNLGRHQRPMGEFWQDGMLTSDGQNKVGKQTATAAHVYGRKTASAEAFTSLSRHWGDAPASLKPTADRAFCEGINRFVFHTMTCTRPQDGKPGYEYGAGTHFNPNVTWWQQAAGPWLSYVNRCQALLQSGLFAADVLFYNGDWAPNYVHPKHVEPSLGKGYDYDVCNAEVLLTRLSVKEGRIVLPDGMSYRLLVLPDSKHMPVEVVRKIRDLVDAGATVVGPRPESDPGLKDYPKSDAEVKKIAAEVWGDCDGQQVKQRIFGKGRVFLGKPLRGILLADGVQPDFEHSGKDAFIDFIHRTADGAEIYFLANRNNRPETVEATFRVSGRQPELWDAVTGERRDFDVFTQKDGCTTVPLEFESYGSMFVVFKKEVTGVGVQGSGKKFLKFKPVLEISGPWTVQFDPKWFYPTHGLDGDQAKGFIAFEKLEDWSKRPEPAVQHFSGTAVYRKVFDLPQLTLDDLRLPNAGGASEKSTINNRQSKMYLSLGTVKETARVKLNGKDLGVVWCAPWRVEITGAVKPGGNALEIEVVNLWPNRLIGDASLPPQERRTRTNVPFEKEKPLNSSGLIGPVRVVMAE
ncbi:MAG: glycosyl hydrolase [Verrucomicrobiota bacterium]